MSAAADHLYDFVVVESEARYAALLVEEFLPAWRAAGGLRPRRVELSDWASMGVKDGALELRVWVVERPPRGVYALHVISATAWHAAKDRGAYLAALARTMVGRVEENS